MAGLYAGGNLITDSDNDGVTGIYFGSTKIWPVSFELKGSVSTNQTNVTPTSRSYSVSGNDGDTGTYQVVFNASSGWKWPTSAGLNYDGKNSTYNKGTTPTFNAARTTMTLTTSYEIGSSNTVDNWSWTSNSLISANPIDVTSIGGNKTPSAGTSAFLTCNTSGGTGVKSYLWSVVSGTGFIESGQTNQIVQVRSTSSSTTTFRCTATESGTNTSDTGDAAVTWQAPTTISSNINSIILPSAGGSKTITITTNDPNGWDSQSVGNFYSISPTTGVNGTVVTISADGANTSGGIYSDTFSVTTINNQDNDIIAVSQGSEATNITVTPSIQQHAYGGQTVDSSLTSNHTGTFTVTGDASYTWLSCSIVTNNKVRCTTDPNTGTQRDAYITVSQNSGSKVFQVRQASAPTLFSWDSTSVGFTSAANTGKDEDFTASGPGSLSFGSNQTWCKVKQKDGDTATISVEENTGPQRSAIVTGQKGSVDDTLAITQATGQSCSNYSVTPTGSFLVLSHHLCGDDFLSQKSYTAQAGVAQTFCVVTGTLKIITGASGFTLTGTCSS